MRCVWTLDVRQSWEIFVCSRGVVCSQSRLKRCLRVCLSAASRSPCSFTHPRCELHRQVIHSPTSPAHSSHHSLLRLCGSTPTKIPKSSVLSPPPTSPPFPSPTALSLLRSLSPPTASSLTHSYEPTYASRHRHTWHRSSANHYLDERRNNP